MRTIKNYFMKVKMDFYFNMASTALDEAYEHMNDSKFWVYMKVFRKYHHKYFDLYSKLGL